MPALVSRVLIAVAVVASSLLFAAPAGAQLPGLPWFPPLFPQPKPPATPAPTPPTTPSVPDAGAPPEVKPVFLGADISHTGYVDLGVLAPDGATAVYFERIGARRVYLGTRTLGTYDQNLFRRATAWRCDRLVRRFEADVVGADGTRYTGAYSVRTPSCRHRFALSLPSRVRRGRTVTVAIKDAWRTGDARPALCIAAPGSRARCRPVALASGTAVATDRFRAGRDGRWKVRLRLGTARPLKTLQVGPRVRTRRVARPPLVLATGDSTMQGVDGYLDDRLSSSAEVVSRLRPGTGISKPGQPSWLKTSRIQSSTLRPRATVVSVGANDGYAMTTLADRRVPCCGEEWVAEYSRRARIMMRTWTRFGGRVVWITLSAPDSEGLRPQFSAVNTAIARAAAGLPRVTLSRMDLLLSPGGVHQFTVMWKGRRVKLYLRDGVHLTPAGTSIVAEAVAAELRRTGTVRAPSGR